jgi:hypothetical protein
VSTSIPPSARRIAQEPRHIADGGAVREDANPVAELHDRVVIGHEVHVAAPQARHDRAEAPREVEVAQRMSRDVAVRDEDPAHVQLTVIAIDALARDVTEPGDSVSDL